MTDRYSDEDPRPLLEIMADPSTSYRSTPGKCSWIDQVFVQGLEMFDRLRIYGNA